MVTITATLLCLLGALGVFWIFRKKSMLDLDKIPGPLWNLLDAFTKKKNDPRRNHINFERLRQKYGPIMRVSQAGMTVVVVSDFESIHQVLIARGKQFGGRLRSFIGRQIFQNTGIAFNPEPDSNWKLLRKLSHRHLRQYSDGLADLETVVMEVSEDMFSVFGASPSAMDPKDVIFDTALKTIATLITGQRARTGDILLEKMREYESVFLTVVPVFAPVYFQLLNVMPCLRYLSFDRWRPYQRVAELQSEIWQILKENDKKNPDAHSFSRLFCEHIQANTLKEEDARGSSLILLLAGVATTSTTFVSAVNILAHRKDVQRKLCEEGRGIWDKTGHAPTLADRPNMPYTRAVLYELLRYTSVVAHGVRHRTREETELKGYRIPANTIITTSLWNLHHDESLWTDPYDFQPERYMDEDGQLVPADHPNRKHLLPFGAGVRVCLGESLALARLFLWLSTLAVRFEVSPAPGNKVEATDPRNYTFGGVLKPHPYEVIFTKRL